MREYLSCLWEAQEEEPGNKSCLCLFLYPTWGPLWRPCYCDPCRAAWRVSTGGEGWGRSGEVNRGCAEQGYTGWEGGTGFIKNTVREVGNVCSALLDRHIVVRMIQWRPVEFGAPAWVRVKVFYSPVVLYLPCKWQCMGKANSILVTLQKCYFDPVECGKDHEGLHNLRITILRDAHF